MFPPALALILPRWLRLLLFAPAERVVYELFDVWLARVVLGRVGRVEVVVLDT